MGGVLGAQAQKSDIICLNQDGRHVFLGAHVHTSIKVKRLIRCTLEEGGKQNFKRNYLTKFQLNTNYTPIKYQLNTN